MIYVSLACGFEDTCLHKEQMGKAVEKVGGGFMSVWPKLLGRPAMFYVGLARGFEDMSLHKE
jgi:hypothetical protein